MDMGLFGNRLKELRGNKSQINTVKEILEKTGISLTAQTLGRYEKGDYKHKPDIEILAALAEYYNVSADYLLGRTDITVTCEYPGWFKEVRIKALEESIEKHKKSLADHLSCIDKLTEELNALRWEGKENDKQENQARSV